MEQLLMDDKNNDYVFDITEEWISTDTVSTITIDTTAQEDLYIDTSTDSTTITGADIDLTDDSWGNLSSLSITITEFENCMPDIYKIKNMCEHYPALEKAYENFVSIYKMVHQDYVGNYQTDDEVPF
jgi:hypothetical protein